MTFEDFVKVARETGDNAPEDEWYNEVAIMLDLNNAESLRKTDFILKTIVQKKQTYHDLLKLKDGTL